MEYGKKWKDRIMTLLEFNEICYSLGWEDDIGYSFGWEDDIGYTQPT